jgi:hypothetical protein
MNKQRGADHILPNRVGHAPEQRHVIREEQNEAAGFEQLPTVIMAPAADRGILMQTEFPKLNLLSLNWLFSETGP